MYWGERTERNIGTNFSTTHSEGERWKKEQREEDIRENCYRPLRFKRVRAPVRILETVKEREIERMTMCVILSYICEKRQFTRVTRAFSLFLSLSPVGPFN